LEENVAEVEKMESLPPSRNTYTAIVVLCVLIGDMARGILFPSLWLLVKSLSGSKVYQGVAVSAFSAGRIISSPIFGWLSEKFGYRSVLIACNAILFFGCYIYSLGKSVNGVILGQFIIGIGAGSLGVTRSYVAEKTHRTERTLYMAYMT
jgi:MFS family permease